MVELKHQSVEEVRDIDTQCQELVAVMLVQCGALVVDMGALAGGIRSLGITGTLG